MIDPFNRSRADQSKVPGSAGEDRRVRTVGPPAEVPSRIRRSDLIKVINETGADLPPQSVVGLDDPIIDPGIDENGFLQEVTFKVSTPAARHRGRFAVLLEPAADGRIARAWAAGFCPVRVDMLDEGHSFADIDPGEAGHLVSTDAGAAKIVWTQGDVYGGYGYGAYGEGVQWAIVHIGQIYGGLIRAQAPSGGIAAGAAGACKVYDPDHTLGTYTISARNRTGNDVGDEADVYVAWIEREREFQVVQEICPEAYA